jgi:hypothetical protein
MNCGDLPVAAIKSCSAREAITSSTLAGGSHANANDSGRCGNARRVARCGCRERRWRPEIDKKLKEPTTAQLKIAKAIAKGHAYEKHVVGEKLFPEVKNRDDFIELIAKVLANPTHHRKLENDPGC